MKVIIFYSFTQIITKSWVSILYAIENIAL